MYISRVRTPCSVRYLIMQKKTHAKFGATLLVAAMLSLVGVGFALTYSGSAQNTDNETSGELITVGLSSYSGFLDGIYTVATANNGTDITLSGLEKDGAAATMADVHFAYDAGAFTVADAASGYTASEIGTVTVTLTQPTTATATDVELAISGAPAAVINQYGLSLVYVMDGEVIDPADVLDITMSGGSATVTVSAYVVYSDTVPVGSIAAISVFNIPETVITFTATAATA